MAKNTILQSAIGRRVLIAAATLLLFSLFSFPPSVFCAPSDVFVPQVGGMTAAQAKHSLERVGLRARLIENYTGTRDRRMQGRVAIISPLAGTKVPRGTTVTVYTYRYRPAAAVPNLTGMTIDQARLIVEEVGMRFRLADKPTPTKNRNLVGKVAAQSPVAGVHAGRDVEVTVSPYVLQ